MMRKSVGLRPFALGGGSSAQTSSNSASDISVEYRSRMTSYFTRSASFQGIASLPKLLQIQGIKPREASQPISGQALRKINIEIVSGALHKSEVTEVELSKNDIATGTVVELS